MKVRYVKILEPCYHNTLKKIKNKIGENNIRISVDETINIKGRYGANLLVGILKSNTPTRPFLLTCKVLEKTYHSTVVRFINDELKILWPLGGNDEKVLLMLLYAAPYMTKTGDTLSFLLKFNSRYVCSSHDEQDCRESVQRNIAQYAIISPRTRINRQIK
ncbi:uncharacterized protein LOC112687696 isoform X3 [Sipha flava]|uniref:Uncharacterized protein LOC112687696 isoform X3 n=1 Tax=Sipha flava TaxID=143950 RepID=A0A8B8FZE9_9HEMI|nr:uncharacterized protein LOC112687696 isoform X3 [Sipha flava]